ncbi:hypothetical protein GCM10007160_39250 [Litchfieldella qijiaojingensis]|uniref:PRC-barrel domain-containing protein n=1 Tax=Litchfieldella qijiaojingensis TaxID=980347 RepID=A0ABQ2Z8H7_9GAMM|nr:PRC-barrel domain-containing protein [Halomonas qijiaojingensis]GGY07958.1 hypothetical protein GCM10007160_39250 [Halomonas qijiaojingensis]
MHKHVLTVAIAALAGSLALGAQAVEEPGALQGLYAADDILGSDVFLADDPEEDVGSVENLLLDDDMRVTAIVVKSGEVLGMGGRGVVVEAEQFRLESELDEAGVATHRILVEATAEEMEAFPEYDRDWWEQAREQARETWEKTREGAASAWQGTREALTPDEEPTHEPSEDTEIPEEAEVPEEAEAPEDDA